MTLVNPASTDPIQYPTVEIGGKAHPIKLTCASLIRLKNAGIDMFEQPPFDPMNDAHLAAIKAVEAHDAIAVPSTEDATEGVDEARAKREQHDEVRAVLVKAVRFCEDVMMPARRDWKAPLDRGTVVDRLETAAKVIAIAISPAKAPMDYMDLLDQIPMTEALATFYALSEAIKKATALNATKK